jgi:hypothetical protein
MIVLLMDFCLALGYDYATGKYNVTGERRLKNHDSIVSAVAFLRHALGE